MSVSSRQTEAIPDQDIAVWASIPVGPMKEHIVELCNRELAKRRPPPETEPASDDVPDAPLVRGYAFLRASFPLLGDGQ